MPAAITLLGLQLSTKYTLTGPDGTVATFNEPADANFVGYVTEITGLDSPEVRENAENLSGLDGGVHGVFLYGRRPITIAGSIINVVSNEDRNKKVTKLQQASNAMRADATLEWTNEGGEAVFVKLRRQQPIRVAGGWAKDFQLLMVAADPRIYSVAEQSGETEPKNAAPIASGNGPANAVASSDGKHVYVLNETGETITVYSRAPTTGKLGLIESIAAAAGAPKYIAIAQDGKSVYVAGTTSLLKFSRNTISGALTVVGSGVALTEPARGLSVGVNTGKWVVVLENKKAKLFERVSSTSVLTEKTALTNSAIEEGCLTESEILEEIFYVGSAKSEEFVVLKAVSTGLGILDQTKINIKPTTISCARTSNQAESMFVANATSIIGGETFFSSGGAAYGAMDTTASVTLASGVISHQESLFESGELKIVVTDNTNSLIYIIAGSNMATLSLAKVYTSEAKPTGIAISSTTENVYVYIPAITAKTVQEFKFLKNTLGKRGSGAFTVTNKGDMESFGTFTVTVEGAGSINELVITNSSYGESLVFAGEMVPGKYVINMLNRTVVFNNGSKPVSAYGIVNSVASSWFSFRPGANEVTLSATGITGANKVAVKFNSAWI